MQKPTLKKVTKQTNNKWANMYKFEYQKGDVQIEYNVASRRELTEKNLDEKKLDAIVVLPYIVEGNNISVVFIKEFRYPINQFIYDIPAGMTDPGLTPEQTVAKELKEEVGAELVKLETCTDFCFISPGTTNETSQTYFAQVTLTGKQHLESNELIEVNVVPLEKVLKFINSHLMAVQGKLIAKLFYYKTMFEKLTK